MGWKKKMVFKLDAINKYKRVIRETLEEKPYLTLNMQDNAVEYFKEMVPILTTKLTHEELNVMIEDMSLTLSGSYNDRYYLFKKIFDSLILFRVDPEVVLGGAYEISGLTGLNI
jgi:hypothetical protein